jgi:hypothetical protein
MTLFSGMRLRVNQSWGISQVLGDYSGCGEFTKSWGFPRSWVVPQVLIKSCKLPVAPGSHQVLGNSPGPHGNSDDHPMLRPEVHPNEKKTWEPMPHVTTTVNQNTRKNKNHNTNNNSRNIKNTHHNTHTNTHNNTHLGNTPSPGNSPGLGEFPTS